MNRFWILISFAMAVVADVAVRVLLSTPSFNRVPAMDFAAAFVFAAIVAAGVWLEMYARLERMRAERDRATRDASDAHATLYSERGERLSEFQRLVQKATAEKNQLEEQLREAMNMYAAEKDKYNSEYYQNTLAHTLISEMHNYIVKLETDIYKHPQLHYQWPKALRDAWEAENGINEEVR